VTVKDAAIIV